MEDDAVIPNNRERKYWVSRPDKDNLDYFAKELSNGKLRQGWGYSPELDLNQILSIQKQGGTWWMELSTEQNAAYRNYPFHPGFGEFGKDTMRAGDIVLMPNIPSWGSFSLAEILDDTYAFDRSDTEDYGHCRSVKLLTPGGIPNDNHLVDAGIRSTLKNRGRIWRINHLSEAIDKLINAAKNGVIDSSQRSSPDDRYKEINKSTKLYARKKAQEHIEKLIDTQFQGAEFECAVSNILEHAFPGTEVAWISGGASEAEHGTDILISQQHPFADDQPFLIPVQVKKHTGTSDSGVSQLRLAYNYWEKEAPGRVIALVLANTADLSENAATSLNKLSKETGIPCYHLDKNRIIEMFVDAAIAAIED